MPCRSIGRGSYIFKLFLMCLCRAEGDMTRSGGLHRTNRAVTRKPVLAPLRSDTNDRIRARTRR